MTALVASEPFVGGLTLGVASLFGLAALQRLGELVWSRSNVARLEGGRDSETRADFARMVGVHVALLGLPLVEAALRPAPPPPLAFVVGVLLFALAQALRVWTLVTLGRSWNARAVVDPELGFENTGPYRWIRHPNYVAVLAEFVALPLAAGAWVSLVLLNAAHAWILARRIRGEEAQLERIPGYLTAMGGKGRFVPRLGRSRPRGPHRPSEPLGGPHEASHPGDPPPCGKNLKSV